MRIDREIDLSIARNRGRECDNLTGYPGGQFVVVNSKQLDAQSVPARAREDAFCRIAVTSWAAVCLGTNDVLQDIHDLKSSSLKRSIFARHGGYRDGGGDGSYGDAKVRNQTITFQSLSVGRVVGKKWQERRRKSGNPTRGPTQDGYLHGSFDLIFDLAPKA